MNRHIDRFKNLMIDRPLDEIMDTLEEEGPKQAIKKDVPLLAAGLVAVGLLVLVLALLCAGLGLLRGIIAPVLVAVVLAVSYFENHKSTTGPGVTKEPTMEQYITVGNIVKMAAKRVAPMLELSPIYEETDIKAAKDERLVQCQKYWLLKFRFLKKNVETIIDTNMAEQVLQSEIQTVLDNDNPAGFDKVRFVYGGVDESILQVHHVSQGRAYIFIYCCYASEEYFKQREQEREQHGHENTADTADIDF